MRLTGPQTCTCYAWKHFHTLLTDNPLNGTYYNCVFTHKLHFLRGLGKVGSYLNKTNVQSGIGASPGYMGP